MPFISVRMKCLDFSQKWMNETFLLQKQFYEGTASKQQQKAIIKRICTTLACNQQTAFSVQAENNRLCTMSLMLTEAVNPYGLPLLRRK